MRASEACYDMAMAYGTPFISGKDSLHNEFRIGEKRIVIPHTLLISAISIVKDIRKCVSMDAKGPGDMLYLVGQTRDNPYLSLGVSTRGAIALYNACQALAWLRGRDHVLPDDVKELFLPVCSHRVMVRGIQDGAAERREKADNALRELLQTTAVPL